MNKFFAKNDVQAWQWISFAVIATLVCLVYATSLMHVARSDQVMYLAEVGHRHTLWDLTIGSMDLNRHRMFSPGDEILFRPVDYMLLGFEKYFFGNHFMLWQAVGILLHLVVVWFLLKCFLGMYRGVAAVMAAAYFALLFVNMEMVTWHHIHGYMIFVAVSLYALHRFFEVMNGKVPSSKDCFVIFLVLLIASLTHEMGNVVALVLGTIVLIYKPQYRLFYRAFFLVPAAYVLASLFNAWAHPFNTTMYHHHLTQILGNGFYAMGVWLYTGLFPFELQWLFAARNMIAPEEKYLIKWPHLNNPASLFALIIIAMLVFFLFHKRRSLATQNATMVAGICFALVAIFSFIIAIGRGSQWLIWEVIRVNTYYMYIFWVFMIVGVFAMVPWKDIGRVTKGIFYFILAALIYMNAQQLYLVNDKQVQDNNQIIVLVNTLEMFVAEHKNERGFSFYVAPNYPGNFIYPELRRTDDPKTRQYSFIEALYPQYFNAEEPQYKFLVR